MRTDLSLFNSELSLYTICALAHQGRHITTTADYVKEIDNMTTERARLDKEVTDCLLVAPKEATPIRIEQPQETDKVKIRVDLKPETLTDDVTPVKFRILTKEFKVLFRSSNLWKGEKIERQQALIKLIDSVLAAKLRGKINNDTPSLHRGSSSTQQGEQFTSYMTRLKETLEECDLHNISREDVILLIATMHCNKEELRKDIKRYRYPTWLAVEHLAKNYERSMVDKEPHKVGQVKRQDNNKKTKSNNKSSDSNTQQLHGKCFRCGNTGRKSNELDRTSKCLSCGKAGHLAKVCLSCHMSYCVEVDTSQI